MPENYYIAIDLGAESGRVIVGILANSKLEMIEIHRFPSKQFTKKNTVYWDIEFIFDEIKLGIIKASELGFNKPKGIGVDSWGVDYGLLDKNDQLIEPPITYRDKRFDGIMDEVFEIISKENIYKIAGIQFLQFNSIFQLYASRKNDPSVLAKAESFLMIPDLINFFLTTQKYNEYTNSTTTSLMEAKSKTISEALYNKLNIPIQINEEIILPSEKIGRIKSSLIKELKIYDTDVIAVGSHDTASAIAAVPADGDNWAYLSSGTWSLLGIEVKTPILTDSAQKYSFTNEGGVENKICFLKNIIGLWVLQRSRLSWSKTHEKLSYSEITDLAESAEPFQGYFDPDSDRFFNPKDMIQELLDYFKDTGQTISHDIGSIGRMILENLAFKISDHLKELQEFKEESIEVLHVVGGGSKNQLLNQFISNACNVKVIAGPDEGTAAGNIMVQALSSGDVNSLKEIRRYIRNSFTIHEYEPRDHDLWTNYYKKFLFVSKL